MICAPIVRHASEGATSWASPSQPKAWRMRATMAPVRPVPMTPAVRAARTEGVKVVVDERADRGMALRQRARRGRQPRLEVVQLVPAVGVRVVEQRFKCFSSRRDGFGRDQRPRRYPVECCEDFRNEGHEILHTIGQGSDDHDPKRENRDILLVLEVSIDRHEGIDQAACSLQQGAVLCSVPAQTLHRRNGMANQRVDQVVRKVLVKQYAHVSAGFRARAQELRWLVRVERTETA